MKNFNEYIKENIEFDTFQDFRDKFNINVEKIFIGSSNIKDLIGIEDYYNLKKLVCPDNQITSLEPLKNLNKLRNLFCSINKITSLVPLEKLDNLEVLWCHRNQLQSYKGLPENIHTIQSNNNPLNNWQEDIESFIRAYKLSSNTIKKWFDKQKHLSEIIDLIKINMI